MMVEQGGSAAGPIMQGARAQQRAGASLRATITILLMLVLGYALTVLVFQPGYMTADALFVYEDGKAWNLGDWQSPVMVLLWRLIDPVAPGAWSMFLLIATLYWVGFGALALIAARRSALTGIVTPLLALAPPAFMLVGMIWRDVLFAVVWLLAAVLALAVAERAARVRLPVQVLALVLVALGVLLRPNAVIAAPILAAYIAWPARLELKRAAIMFLPAALAFSALVPAVYYGLLHAKRQSPIQQFMVYDLGGITYFTGENQFPVQWDAQETTMLTGPCYSPVRWDVYWHTAPCPFVMARLESKDDPVFGTPRLTRAWWRAVSAHPFAYLQHRTSFMANFLGRPNLVLPYLDWAEPDAAYGKNPFFRPLLVLHDLLERTVLFRPGLWLLLATAVGAAAWPARSTPEGAFAIGVSASAIVYVMTFFVVGVASDFRYAYWCVIATLAGAVAWLLAWHDRRAEHAR